MKSVRALVMRNVMSKLLLWAKTSASSCETGTRPNKRLAFAGPAKKGVIKYIVKKRGFLITSTKKGKSKVIYTNFSKH